MVPDRDKAAARGVSVKEIGDTINAMIGGVRVGKYTQGGRRYDIRIAARVRGEATSRRTSAKSTCGTTGAKWSRSRKWCT